MGLFKKRATDPAEMERLKSEIAAMGARLDAVDSAKDALGNQVHVLSSRLDAAPAEPIAPPPMAPPSVSEGEIDLLRARVQRLSDRLDEGTTPSGPAGADSTDVDDLRSRVDAVQARLDDALAAGDDGDVPSIDPAEFDMMRERLDALTHRFESPLASPPPPPVPIVPGDVAPGGDPAAATIDATELTGELTGINERLDALAARLDEVDIRITSISTELANQISELSGDIDTLGGDAPATGPVVDELRDAQTRLASEQARYQIAFREDLAALAERLKRA